MKKGFTLAEILLALTIIGVIASVTLPGLSVNVAEKRQRAWHSKYCTIIDGAISAALVDSTKKATELTWSEVSEHLKGKTVDTDFKMKDGTIISYANTVYTVNFADSKVSDTTYTADDALGGLDCSDYAK